MQDYVVAINIENDTVTGSWKGDRYKNLDTSKIHQFRISGALSKEDAETSALRILKKVR